MTPLARFVTLMHREWLQHRTGWLVLMVGPSLLMVVLAVFEGRGLEVRIDGDNQGLPPLRELQAVLQTLGWTVATVTLAFVLTSLTVLLQLPGLARRDQQDRSIEFWRSLPTSHLQGVGATLLMHLIVLPGLALSAAVLGAQAAAAVSVFGTGGLLAWWQQPWWTLLLSAVLLLLRLWLGLVLAVLWLSPLLMLTMVASAWLKRWALPAVGAALALGMLWLDPRLPMPVVKPAVLTMGTEALNALLTHRIFGQLGGKGPDDLLAMMPEMPMNLLRDAGGVLADAASPAFAAALALGLLGFSLLVWRRQMAD